MGNFWDFNSWGFFNLLAVLMLSLLAGNMLKRSIPALQASLTTTATLTRKAPSPIISTYSAERL